MPPLKRNQVYLLLAVLLVVALVIAGVNLLAPEPRYPDADPF